MSEWIRAGLDCLLIAIVLYGIFQMSKLIRHLMGLRQGRIEMERFVHEFNATVIRAEAGVKGLRQAARDSGDDLEKLVEKATLVRDELQLILPSADQIAERLSQLASSSAALTKAAATAPKAVSESQATPTPSPIPTAMPLNDAPSSRAEKELLQALKKLS